MNRSIYLLALLCFSCGTSPLFSQSSRGLSIQFGLFGTRFSKSDLRLVQEVYDTDVIVHDFRAQDNNYFNILPSWNVGILQYRAKGSYEFERGWGVEAILSHQHYEGITRDSLRMEGRWQGLEIDETVWLFDRVRKFEHSHAITTLNVGGYKRFTLPTESKLWSRFFPLLRLNAGIPIPNSAAEIFNPQGDIENIQPQYRIAGISASMGAAVRVELWKGLYFEPNFNGYGIWIFKALLPNGYSRHNFWGFDWGADLGWKFDL